MTRPTLANGDIWGDSLANAAGFPVLDGSDDYGHGPKVVDDWLDDGSDQIKSRFYSFYDRIKVTISTGLTLAYTGAPVMLTNGTVTSVSPGTINIPANSTRFVFVNNAGAVASATTLPTECIPLAVAITDDTTITSLTDLRYQQLDQVRPVALPSQGSVLLPGDIKVTFRQTLEAGFLRCDGAQYSTSAYPALFAAIGYTFGGTGSVFNVPDMRGRTLVGAGQGAGLTNRSLGATGGAETVALTVNQMPSHNHSVSEDPHDHGVTEPAHNHDVIESAHTHTLTDPGHNHQTADRFTGSSIDPADVIPVARQKEGLQSTTSSKTGITIAPSTTGISLRAARTGLTVRTARTNLSVNANGGGAAHNNMPPYINVWYLIKT